MTAILLHIHDYLAKHKPLAWVFLAILIAAGVALALRLQYKENIADFLPRDKTNEKQAAVYNALGDQGRITVLFRPSATATTEDIMDAIDLFSERWTEGKEAILPQEALQSRAEESEAMLAIEEVRSNIALYLRPEDYRRIDSLLSEEGYVDRCMASVRQTLSMPLPEMVSEMITADPLNLFSPAIARLQTLNPSEGFSVRDGYLFDSCGIGYAFVTSPYGGSDTKNNSRVARQIEEACREVGEVQGEKVSISAVGAPLIAAANANQIKRDSLTAMLLSIILIAVILWRTMGYKRNILWMGFSVAAGWLFALAAIAIFKTEISIIVVGIGSVLIGIAVNYPLHYLEHIKEHPNRRETLKEMVEPLITGNITTVAAFACLVFVKAEAMRDLGLFGSLMLVGTIGFVMIFLPLWAREGRKREPRPTAAQKAERTKRIPAWSLWVVVGITIVLGYFSTEVEFDSDLHNINYMTSAQQEDLAHLSQSVSEEEIRYVVAEGKTLDEALSRNDLLGQQGGIAALMPSLNRQKEALGEWEKMREKYSRLAEETERSAAEQGLSAQAVRPFTESLRKEYKAEEMRMESGVGRIAREYILQSDTGFSVVTFARESLREDIPGTYSFTQADVGSTLVSALNDDFNYILYVCSFVVFAFLWIAFGRLELAILAFLPMAAGWIWILGLMAILGIKFNIVNIILATFIFGQGDDYTIFITEGLIYENATGKRRLREYRKSVLVSAGLMFVGIGTLIVSRHPAMRSLAEVAIVGMLCVVLMACIVPPVIFRWLTERGGEPRRRPITIGRILNTWIPILVLAVFVLIVGTPYTLVQPLLPGKKERKRERYHTFITRTARMGAKLLPSVGFREENPYGERFERPAVVVANHQSHLDLLCILMLHPKMVLLTKRWVYRNPLYAHIIRHAEYLPVEEGIERLMPKLQDLAHRGYSIMLFPEGTRSHDGETGRFHRGAIELAERLGLDILPIYIHGAYDVWPRSERLLSAGEITTRIGRRINPATLGERPASKLRQHFVEELSTMHQRLGTPQYYRQTVCALYLYKGREIGRKRPGTDIICQALANPQREYTYNPETEEERLLMENRIPLPKNVRIGRGDE